ncbi:MAG: hypothetical protein OEY23_26680, partial [Acidimicrobiia bacterium]|nr:hypothetical protein [Acidimicrobiia bacterium]
MKKIFALVAVLSVATGCATWRDGDVIATVAGSDITVAELRDEFATLAEVPDVARLFKNLD